MSWYPDGYVAGAKPTAERERQYEMAKPVGKHLKAISDLIEKREKAREKRRNRAVRHLSQYYDGYGVLREGPGYDVARGWVCIAGRFAKNTAPPHKRPKRKPWKRKSKPASDS